MSYDFSWLLANSYSAPAYNAVDFTFAVANDTGTTAIEGTSAAGFYPIVEALISCEASVSGVGYNYGFAELPLSPMAGTSTFTLSAAGFSSGYYDVAGQTVQSIIYDVLSGGTYSLFDNAATTSFPSKTYFAGSYSASCAASSSFDPYYAVSIQGVAAVTPYIGGVDSRTVSIAGMVTGELTSQMLRSAYADTRGSTTLVLLPQRVSRGEASVIGSSTSDAHTHTFAGGIVAVEGTVLTSFGQGSVIPVSLALSCEATLDATSSNYALSSISIFSAGELVGYIGGMVTKAFISAGSAGCYGESSKVLAGEANSFGETSLWNFYATHRVQAIRYETDHVFTRMPEMFICPHISDTILRTLTESVVISTKQQDVAITLPDHPVWVRNTPKDWVWN